MRDNRFIQFIILGVSIMAFLLAVKFLAQFIPTSHPVLTAMKGAIEAA